MAGGVLPVLKHIPGHGRALADSHHELPVVAAGRKLLEESDFEPFRRLSGMPLAMTAHIVYQSVDPSHPATASPEVIGDIIRDSIGFDGLLMTDDISMKALAGTFLERTSAALAAGCDVVLHCNGDPGEMEQVAAAARRLDGSGLRRYMDAVAAIGPPEPLDRPAALVEFADLMGDDRTV
jgi:beta-N-acetylhexosaminidase